METSSKVLIGLGAGFLLALVGFLATVGQGDCFTGKYQNQYHYSPEGEMVWTQEPIYQTNCTK